MATIALGAAFGPVGAMAGAYIDQNYLYPALFPADPVKGPRLQELQIQSADESAPFHRFGGTRPPRAAGVIIWTSELRESKSTDEVGGKGGPTTDVENYAYTLDILICWGEGPADGLGVEAVERINGDASLIYDDEPDVNLSGTDITATIEEEFTWNPQTNLFDNTYKAMRLQSVAEGTALNELLVGVDVVIGGWTETEYNGTFKCVVSKINSAGLPTAKFAMPLSTDTTGEASGNTITLDQTNVQFDPTQMDAVTQFLGTETQTFAGTIVETEEGVGAVPGYRGLVCTLIENFQLTKGFNNRFPNFTAEINVATGDDLEDVFGDTLAYSDLAASEYDVTDLAGTACDGFISRGPQPMKSTLQPLMMAFDVVAQEDQAQMAFRLRSGLTPIVVATDDLTAHEEGSRDVPVPHLISDLDRQVPPAEVMVKYSDTENALQPGEQRERRRQFTSATQKQEIELPISMDGGFARDIAAKVLWQAWQGRRQHEIQVPPSYITIQESDIVTYSYAGESYRFITNNIAEGENGVRVITGVSDLAAHLSHASPHEAPVQPPNQDLYTPYDCRVEIIDVAPLRSSDTLSGVVYAAVSSRNADASLWRGATLYESIDGGVTFNVLQTVGTQATMGVADTALGSGAGRSQWDRGSTLTVTLDSGVLSSRTEADVLNGANRAVSGEEIIGFVTATLTSGTTYDLTGLLRGLGGTDFFIDNHNVGERFIALNPLGIEPVSLATSVAGATRQYKAVAPGGDVADATAREVTFELNSLRPPGPVHIAGTIDDPATDDWTFTWVRQSRGFFRVFEQPAPLFDNEQYEVDVYDTDGTTLLRTITNVATAAGSVVDPDARTCIYDATDQTTDGGPFTTIRIRVVQLCQVGRGKESELFVLSENT